MKRYVLKIAATLLVCISFCSFCFASQANAGADGASGSTEDGATDFCKKTVAVDRWWNDDCAGASWRPYPLTTYGNINILDPTGTKVIATVNGKRCMDIGATHYYLLAYEKWNGTAPNYNYLGQQVGAVKVKWMTKWFGHAAEGHNVKVLESLPGTLAWSKVQGDFETAQRRGATFNTDWLDTTWFCWNEEWRQDNVESNFDAWSHAGKSTSVGDFTNATAPDYETATKTYTTTESTFPVALFHEMRYNRPTVNGTYGAATTSWRTEVTINGQIQADKAQSGQLRVDNAGKGSEAWWSGYIGLKRFTVDVPESGSVEVCSRIIYEPKYIKWKDQGGQKFAMDTSASHGSEDSKACVIITREEVEEEEAGQIRFISRSSVRASSDVQSHTATSNDAGEDTVTLHIATTKDFLDVDFWHDMRYLYESKDGGAIEPIRIPPDEFKNGDYIKTEWSVHRSSDDRSDANADIGNGEFKFNSSSSTVNGVNFTKVNGDNRYRIQDIEYGETVKVCEKITFTKAIFPIGRKESYKRIYAYVGASTYEGATMYKRTPNPNYIGPAGEKYEDKQEYNYTPVSLYHYVPGYWNETTNKWVDEQYVSGAKIGETAYYRADDGTYSSDLYVVGYQPTSTYADNSESPDYPPNNLGYFVANEREHKIDEWSSYWYTTYSSSGIYHWVSWTEGYPTADGGWVDGHDNYASGYGRDAEGNYDGSAIYGANGVQLYEPMFKSVRDHWIYYPLEGEEYGEGFSEACISVTRPEDPTKPGETDPNGGPISGPVSGSPDGGFVYAGETDSNVSWSTAAISYATRRVMQARAIVYEPTVNVQSRDDISKGNLWDNNLHQNRTDPCTWYRNKVGTLRGNCITIDEVGGNYWSDGYGAPYTHTSSAKNHILNNSISAIIPDYVGDKYCNSFGYELAYWYGITHSNPETEEWHQEGNSYWAIYDAACRTIVKKPSLNLWNGSLFTNGNVQTTIANRYLNPVLGGTLANPRGSGVRRDFGSWSEYLAVVGGSIRGNSAGGFGSGSSLSFAGIFGTGDNLLKNISPLTVANKSPNYGYSGVEAGSTFRARLNTYLKPLSTTSSVTGLQNVNETIIVDAGSVANITENITLSSRAYASVYQLPQIIIFADDINISGNVTKIDAWLIAKNNINTCSEFVSGEGKTPSSHSESEAGTEAHIAGYNNDAVCSKQLTVNGPIISGSIELNRSHGSDPLTDSDVTVLGGGTNARAIPGEAFNLSADSYLWAYAQAGRYDSSYTEAYTRELPPRY